MTAPRYLPVGVPRTARTRITKKCSVATTLVRGGTTVTGEDGAEPIEAGWQGQRQLALGDPLGNGPGRHAEAARHLP